MYVSFLFSAWFFKGSGPGSCFYGWRVRGVSCERASGFVGRTAGLGRIVLLVGSLSGTRGQCVELCAGLRGKSGRCVILCSLTYRNFSTRRVCRGFYNGIGRGDFRVTTGRLCQMLLSYLIRLERGRSVRAAVFGCVAGTNVLFRQRLFSGTLTRLRGTGGLTIACRGSPLLLLVCHARLGCLDALNFRNVDRGRLMDGRVRVGSMVGCTHGAGLRLRLCSVLGCHVACGKCTHSGGRGRGLGSLILDRLGLVTGRSCRKFRTRGLRLLFRTACCLGTKGCGSTVHFCRRLVTLFRTGQRLVLGPPVCCLDTVRKMLGDLRITKLCQRVPFFLSGLGRVDANGCPARFLVRMRKHRCLCRLSKLLGAKRFSTTIRLARACASFFTGGTAVAEPRARLGLSLCSSVLCLYLKRPVGTHGDVGGVLNSNGFFRALPSCGATHLVGLLVRTRLKGCYFFTGRVDSVGQVVNCRGRICVARGLLFHFLVTRPLPVCGGSRRGL